MAADRGGEGLGLEEGSFVVHLALVLPESGVGAERNQLRKSAPSPAESRRFWITILTFEMKLEELTYKKAFVSLEIMISLKRNLEKSQDDSTRHGLMNSLIGWNITSKKMLHFAYYLFKTNLGEKAGGDSFVGTGFSNWKKNKRFQVYVGGPNSSHNQALKKCQALMNEKQHIENVFHKHSHQSRIDYRIKLNASIDCIRFLLRQGLAFRGHNESDDSSNQGNFLELLQFLVDHNEEVRAVALKNAPENLIVTSPKIQKDIVNAAAVETTYAIIRDMDDALFSILVDESRDVSVKEQMVVMFRYVDKEGCVIERFIGYDGANNMSGEFNGLKTLIMRENESAYYVHCFAHQLQLAIVGLAKKHSLLGAFFTLISNVVNIVGASSKRRDILRDKQALKVVEALTNGELSNGKCLNQATEIKRSYDTR
ncbi:unnamed protein product [Prunus armeniaca]